MYTIVVILPLDFMFSTTQSIGHFNSIIIQYPTLFNSITIQYPTPSIGYLITATIGYLLQMTTKQLKLIETFLSSHSYYPGKRNNRYFMITLGQRDKLFKTNKIKPVINSWDQLKIPYILVKVREEEKVHYHAAVFGKEDHILYTVRKYFRNNYWHQQFKAYGECGEGNITDVHSSAKFQSIAIAPVIYTVNQIKSHPEGKIKTRVSEVLLDIMNKNV